jgi:PAS domain-containing protein
LPRLGSLSLFITNELLEKLYRQEKAGRFAAEVSVLIWERIIDTSSTMLVVVDTQRRITRVNQAVVDRLGIKRREAFGRRCCELRADQSGACEGTVFVIEDIIEE